MTRPTAPRTDLQREIAHRTVWKAGVMGALSTATAILAQRFIVLVAVAGGIALTYLAIERAEPSALIALGIYAVGVVGSSVWLAGR